jgi:hypothetical protein
MLKRTVRIQLTPSPSLQPRFLFAPLLLLSPEYREILLHVKWRQRRERFERALLSRFENLNIRHP